MATPPRQGYIGAVSDTISITYRELLDAIPVPVFVVDDDVRIHDMNDAAERDFGLQAAVVYSQRCGEAFGCLYSTESPRGCGRGPSCSDCVVRSSVSEALTGHSVARRRTRFTVTRNGTKREGELLVTASPITVAAAGPRVLLVLEDITEISRLRSIIPICSNCKQVRDDANYWLSVESYFTRHVGVDFTHGICPDCMQRLYPDHAEDGSRKDEEG